VVKTLSFRNPTLSDPTKGIPMRQRIQIGINARLFPTNWRPVLEETAFSRQHGFASIQFPGKPEGLNESHLGASFAKVALALDDAGLAPMMEIVARLNPDGKTDDGQTPMDVLHANLPAILALKIRCVHWHLVSTSPMDSATNDALEQWVISDFHAGVEIAARHGFRFGVEHNEPEEMVFSQPSHVADLLEAVPGLGFVWDFNHTHPSHLTAFKAFIPRMTMLHVSDTPLPETNHHLPVGMGNVDFVDYFHALLQGGFTGAAILEIGGLPKSGGYGRDTDAALVDSLHRLQEALEAAT
jgi:L-ribulose-5-phosphate 3-epimerase